MPDRRPITPPLPAQDQIDSPRLVLRDGTVMPSDDDFAGFCEPHLARYKVPKRWVLVPALPLTPAGKVQKFKVREAILAE